MATAKLVSPTSALRDSYRTLAADFVALGIEQALVTCGKANVGSARAIMRNGGVLASEEHLADRGEIVQRWHIDTGPSRS
jgi:predicted acetyltransferase